MSLYKDPWRGEIRALEHNIIKHRSLQMILALYYAEEIKRKLKSSLNDYNKVNRKLKNPSGEIHIPKTKGRLDWVQAWKDNGLITEKEEEEIRTLINYRNDIGHRIHHLTADLSNYKHVNDIVRMKPNPKIDVEIEKLFKTKPPKYAVYDYEAIERMKFYVDVLPERFYETHNWVISDHNSLIFDTTEKALVNELKKLHAKITKLWFKRVAEDTKINEELKKINELFVDLERPSHPNQTFENGRLSARGEEICYRLFDENYSSIAIAYAMRLSIKSIRKRKKMWTSVGGSNRAAVIFNNLPIRTFYRGND